MLKGSQTSRARVLLALSMLFWAVTGSARAAEDESVPAAPLHGSEPAHERAASPGVLRAKVETPPQQPPQLEEALALLATRATLHRSLLYRFQCDEDLTRRVVRGRLFTRRGVQPEQTMHTRQGILLEQGKDGVATAVRVKIDRRGRVKKTRNGEPVEVELPRAFDPVVAAVPHAQAAAFTTEGQRNMSFRLVNEGGNPTESARKEESGGRGGGRADQLEEYRIRCGAGEIAVEFLDRSPPKAVPVCSALASGQMCIDAANGEIGRIVFYGMDRVDGGCQWNRVAPFALIDQGLLEPGTGARFPSRVKTLFTIDRRDTAQFDQKFENCGFSHIEVSTSYGGLSDPVQRK